MECSEQNPKNRLALSNTTTIAYSSSKVTSNNYQNSFRVSARKKNGPE